METVTTRCEDTRCEDTACQFSREEYFVYADYFYDAVREFNETGVITKTCPVCGELISHKAEKSRYITRCSRDGCLSYVDRGI
ncbi:hypothetical protein FACS1894133_7400 [Clostridia bacterium]|nr:hypothetical protein FACS1894133_7400 [Clostridia bacterium]